MSHKFNCVYMLFKCGTDMSAVINGCSIKDIWDKEFSCTNCAKYKPK